MTVSDDVTITVNPARDRYGHRARRRLLQRSEQRIAFRHRSSAARLDRARSTSTGRRASPATGRRRSTTSRCAGPARCRRRSPATTRSRRSADDGVRLWVNGQLVDRQLGRSGGSDAHQRRGRARRGSALRHQDGILRARRAGDREAAVDLSGAGAGGDPASRSSIRRPIARRRSTRAPIATSRCRRRRRWPAPRPTTACRRRRRSCRSPGAKCERPGHGDVRERQRAQHDGDRSQRAGTYVLRLSVSDSAAHRRQTT